jgi:ankyrin repeat protein
MHTAALHGHIQVLRILLGAGGHTSLKNNGGGQSIHEVAAGGHLECLESLYSNGADPVGCDACGCTPLPRAASGGHVAAARWLIKVY